MSLLNLSARIPRDPYRRPDPPADDALRLDGNEGSRPSAGLFELLDDPALLRDYPSAADLESLLAARYGVEPEAVVVTTGADDALDRCFRSLLEPGRELVLPVPTFEMLHRFAAVAGGTVVPVEWSAEFPTEAVLEAVTSTTTAVTVVSPNNPTGAVATGDDLIRLAAGLPRVAVILDHAYVEYADEDLTPVATTYPNVIVVRTFSKAWGMAGLRVGYAIADPEVATVLRNAGNPYPVPGPSLAMARTRFLSEDDRMTSHVTAVAGHRTRLLDQLGRASVPTPASQGNFVCPDFGRRADDVYEQLRDRGIVTRRFPHRAGLETSIRITVPEDKADFDRLSEALDSVLTEELI